MSLWWVLFGALVIVGLFSNFGVRVAQWAATRPSEPGSRPEPEPLPRVVRGKSRGLFATGYTPSELWLEDGRVLLNTEDTLAEYGWFEFYQNKWFVPETGEFVPKELVEGAFKKIGARNRREEAAARAREYGGAQ